MASRGLTVAVATLLLSGLLGGVPASADQLNAKDDPKASDNLTFMGRKCATQRDKHKRKVVAVIHSCQRFYAFDPAVEDDANRDYGVFWLQSTIDPADGWCATSVSSDVVFSSDAARVVSTAPVKTINTQDPARLVTVLPVDANNHATQEGKIKQHSRFYPDSLAADVTKKDGRTRFRLTWTGSSDHVLALVSGEQISWATADGPPQGTRFGLRKYGLVQKESC